MSKVQAAPVALYDFAKSNGSVSADHMTHSEGPSMTRQEFADECDINTIMKQYDRYLADPMRSVREPIYYDFRDMPDTLMGTMAVIKQGEEAFMTLPAAVRKEFDNDPVAFMDFAADPSNIDAMREWGLAAPPPPPEKALKVEVVNPPDPPPGDLPKP